MSYKISHVLFYSLYFWPHIWCLLAVHMVTVKPFKLKWYSLHAIPLFYPTDTSLYILNYLYEYEVSHFQVLIASSYSYIAIQPW